MTAIYRRISPEKVRMIKHNNFNNNFVFVVIIEKALKIVEYQNPSKMVSK